LLKDRETHPLAGKMTALLDSGTRLPIHLWYEANPSAHDQSYWSSVQTVLERGMLLIFDLGYTHFGVFRQLTEQGVTFVTRAKTNLSYEVVQDLHRSAAVHDRLVWIGKGDTRQQVRLIDVLYQGAWYRYLTNELDPLKLPIAYAVALYWQRWRIEDAYNVVKRLLSLAFFWSGSQNAVELQLWATWLLYGVLVDLTDEVAQALHRPFAAISLEMVYRSLYYFTQACARGDTDDLITYLASNTRLLALVKRKPPPDKLTALLALTSVPNP
jgi:Transposase DDE domain